MSDTGKIIKYSDTKAVDETVASTDEPIIGITAAQHIEVSGKTSFGYPNGDFLYDIDAVNLRGFSVRLVFNTAARLLGDGTTRSNPTTQTLGRSI